MLLLIARHNSASLCVKTRVNGNSYAEIMMLKYEKKNNFTTHLEFE